MIRTPKSWASQQILDFPSQYQIGDLVRWQHHFNKGTGKVSSKKKVGTDIIYTVEGYPYDLDETDIRERIGTPKEFLEEGFLKKKVN